MNGLKERKYDLEWKCANLTAFLLDEELLDLMKESGCYRIISSVESGNQHVVKNIVKKPVDLKKMSQTLEMVKQKGFESCVNFVFGFPDETWDQIRDTCDYAGQIEADLVNFHIATPLPNTELMDTCIERGHLSPDANENFGNIGYSKGLISTEEFNPNMLQILRAFEWDRINFRTEERKRAVAKINSITLDELEDWRKSTLERLGIRKGN